MSITQGVAEATGVSAGDAAIGRVKITDGTTVLKVNTSSATLSNVNSSASNVTLLAANANRLGAIIVNDSTQVLYVKFGATATASSYSYKLAAGDQLELMTLPCYSGIIDGIWASANGAARLTEMT